MSTLIYPVGPEPPGTYWLRRGIVLVVILAILGLVWFVFFRGGGSDSAAPQPSASPTASTTPTVTPSPTGSASGSPTATASPTSTELADCKKSVIEVEASTDDSSYPVGSTPRFTLKVTNGGNVACLRDVGAGANELSVSSGGVPVWSSDDCNPSDATDVVTLKPGQSFSTSITWDGIISEEGCPSGQPAAEAGGYDLLGRNGDVESEPVAFELT